jgi:HEXXH motif-containing protein
MNLTHHQMPQSMFEAMARGGGGAEVMAELIAAQHSRHAILLRGVRELALPGDRCAIEGYTLLASVQQAAPDAAAAVIQHPSVGAWALRTLRGEHEPAGAEPSGLAAVAAAAAIKANLAAEIEVPVSHYGVMLPGLGQAAADGDTAVVRTSPASVSSASYQVSLDQDSAGWQPLRRIQPGGLDALFDDLDPFRMPTADALAPRLNATDTAEWEDALRDAWPLLGPDSAVEVAAVVRVIVPYLTPPDGLVSSSSPENFGTVAMSRQPDPHTYAATLVHEVQHLKLSALLDLVDLTQPDDGRGYYAPWRTDPRPASSLLQGAYAFLGVSGFWRRQRWTSTDEDIRRRADAEFVRWRAASARVVRTLLRSNQLTEAGNDFAGQMRSVLEGWQREPVPAEAIAVARREAEHHLARWQAENGIVPV